MRKSLLSLFLLFSLFLGTSAQTREEKAKALIRTEFKNNMNDYGSYQPVSYSKLDSLFSSPFEDEKFIKLWIDPVIEALEDLNMPSLKVTSDVTPIIEAVKEDPSKYKEGILPRLEIFKLSQDLMYGMLDKYPTQFLGWKITHKYRAKNQYNATVLFEDEFRFNKEITEIISYKPVNK